VSEREREGKEKERCCRRKEGRMFDVLKTQKGRFQPQDLPGTVVLLVGG
jgi:hypothetical protein